VNPPFIHKSTVYTERLIICLFTEYDGMQNESSFTWNWILGETRHLCRHFGTSWLEVNGVWGEPQQAGFDWFSDKEKHQN